MRSDFNGIVVEMGNAPRSPIQSGSYMKSGPPLPTLIVPTSRCSKYTGRWSSCSSASSGRSGKSGVAD